MRRFLLWFRMMGVSGWITLVLISLLTPLAGWAFTLSMTWEDAKLFSGMLAQLLLPLFSVFWPMSAWQAYLCDPTREVMANGQTGDRLADSLRLFFAYLLLCIIPLGAYLLLGLIGTATFVKVLGVCVFLFGVSYLLMAISKNTTMTFLFGILYVVIALITAQRSEPYPLYFTFQEIPLPAYGYVYGFYFVLGITAVFAAEGYLRKKGVF